MKTMASIAATEEETNFARLSQVFLDVATRVLRNLFESEIHPATIVNRVNGLPSKSLKLLNPHQLNIITNSGTNQNYLEYDITLCTFLIRNLCPQIRPTRGWNVKVVNPNEVSIGDDVMRIKMLRNELYGHAAAATIATQDYNIILQKLNDIFTRVDNYRDATGKPIHGNVPFTLQLADIREKCMDAHAQRDYTDKLQSLHLQELETRQKMMDFETGLQQVGERLDRIDPPVPDLIELIHQYKEYLRGQPANDNLIPRRFQGDSCPEKEIRSHDVVFIKGEAGIGKSKYVQQIIRSWVKPTELDHFNEDTPILFYDCKRLSKHHKVESNVAPLYFSTIWQLLGERGKTSKDFMSMKLAGPYNDFIIVIDAVDELSVGQCIGHDYCNRLKLIVQNQDMMSGIETIFSIIYGITFSKAKLIVLGRQHEIDNLCKMKVDDSSDMVDRNKRKILKMIPFTGNDVKILTCKEVCTDQQLRDGNHEKCISIYNRFEHVVIKKIPAYASCLIRCFKNEASTNMGDITKTKLFISMLTNNMRKDECLDDVNDCINVLAELSYKALSDIVSFSTLRGEVSGDNIHFGNMKVNKNICKRMDLFYIREYGDLEPYHLTYLEFLASCYIVKHPEKWNELLELRKDRQILMIPFIAGLTSNDAFSKKFISKMLNCDNHNFIKWLFDLDATNMKKLPDNEYDECGDPKFWYGFNSKGKVMPPFKLLDAINAECRLSADHMPKHVVKDNPQSSREYYNMDGLIHLPIFANNIQRPKNIETFCAAFPGIRVEFKGDLFVEDDDAVELYDKICQLDNVVLNDIDIRCSENVSEDKCLQITLSNTTV